MPIAAVGIGRAPVVREGSDCAELAHEKRHSAAARLGDGLVHRLIDGVLCAEVGIVMKSFLVPCVGNLGSELVAVELVVPWEWYLPADGVEVGPVAGGAALMCKNHRSVEMEGVDEVIVLIFREFGE